ncbi:MAG: DUF192 domain-containing protein [Balneolaceae bacterium]|nr:DUF192 domain-containing protein [Balneolaceae bacterium]
MKLLTTAAIIGLISACSGRQTKSDTKSTKNTNDRGTTLTYSDTLSFVSQGGDTLTTINVAVADEPKERNEGLMNVNYLPPDNGMLFLFDQQQELSFWMANTPLSLDIIFVNADKEIVRIHRSTQPYSEQNFTSGEPALYAVETNGGFSVSHDIQEGMKVVF